MRQVKYFKIFVFPRANAAFSARGNAPKRVLRTFRNKRECDVCFPCPVDGLVCPESGIYARRALLRAGPRAACRPPTQEPLP
jgi:hypothetical protein